MRSLDMKYSVLMPVYRKENPFYFYRAALSMMKQSVSPDEFVLVCDGPLTKELDAVIRKLEETWSEQVKIVRLPENRGIGPALAAGVESCRNNLIARMDSSWCSSEATQRWRWRAGRLPSLRWIRWKKQQICSGR